MLEVIELDGQQKKMPVNLSGGMKKRVGLALDAWIAGHDRMHQDRNPRGASASASGHSRPW